MLTLLEIDSATFWAVVVAVFTFLGGIAAALFGPYVGDWASKTRLRTALYRELVNWHEQVSASIRYHDRVAFQKYYFTPLEPPSGKEEIMEEARPTDEVQFGKSIKEAEINPQYGDRT